MVNSKEITEETKRTSMYLSNYPHSHWNTCVDPVSAVNSGIQHFKDLIILSTLLNKNMTIVLSKVEYPTSCITYHITSPAIYI